MLILKLIVSTSLLFAETYTGFDSFVGTYDVQSTSCHFVISGETSDECPDSAVVTQVQIIKGINDIGETTITVIEKTKESYEVMNLQQELSDLSNPKYFAPSAASSLWMNWSIEPEMTVWKIVYVGPGKKAGQVEFFREFNAIEPGMKKPLSGRMTYSLKSVKK